MRKMRKKKTRTRKQQRILVRNRRIGIGVLILVGILLIAAKISGVFSSDEYWELSDDEITAAKPEITVDLLDLNEYSRP